MENLSSTLQDIVRKISLAPSGHNTQPWKIKASEGEICIYPDFSRALPVVDPNNHALYIALGCATENAVISASHHGFDSQVDYTPDENRNTYIRIRLTENPGKKDHALYPFIEKRQSTRNANSERAVPEEELKAISEAIDIPGVEIIFITKKIERDNLAPFIIEGSNRQFANKAFVEELVDWMRFSKREASRKKTGVWGGSMGLPDMGRFLGRLIMTRFVSPKSEAKRWEKLLNQTAGLALFVAEENMSPGWINTGRAFERFALAATRAGISHAHVNMPCEEVAVREKMAGFLGLKGKHPLLLIRFGYSEPMPRSFRLNPEEILQP